MLTLNMNVSSQPAIVLTSAYKKNQNSIIFSGLYINRGWSQTQQSIYERG